MGRLGSKAVGSREPCWPQPTLSQDTQLGQAVPAPHRAVVVGSLEPVRPSPMGPPPSPSHQGLVSPALGKALSPGTRSGRRPLQTLPCRQQARPPMA